MADFVPDLAAAFKAIARGGRAALEPRGASFRHWAQRLAAEAQDADRMRELAFWSGMLRGPSLRLIAGELIPIAMSWERQGI